jgi:alpha-1,3-rhamnosyl/mannosyltransferase
MVAEHTWLAARTRDADVVHHGGGTAPLVGPGRIVLTVHDLQYLSHPEFFSPARRRYLQAMMPRSASRASVITTPSEYVRGTVIDAFSIDPDRVRVVPHGVPDLAEPTLDERLSVRRRFGLGERPYVVYPAITHPHKRHHVLLDMLQHLEPDMTLVLVGGSGAGELELVGAIAESGLGDRVVRPGRVTDDERDALVADAVALVFPSAYEGFGAPLVEAMALGTPVVCSDVPAVREVVGESAIVVDGLDGEAWAAAVERAVAERARLVTAGSARRAAFTDERSGAALLGAYRLAAT